MADDKNIANLRKNEVFLNEGVSGNSSQETIVRPEREGVIEDSQKLQESISQTVDDIKGEGEFGGIQPIGGFETQNTKRQKDIEDILSRDLTDIYLQLPPEKQQEFKTRGEVTAREINGLLDKAKFEIGKIVDLIRSWLFIIPGVNKFFIEQEAKIKTDEIIRLKGV